MATDRDVLIFVHERLAKVHGESELKDYMHALRRVIAATPLGQDSPSIGVPCNSLQDLQRELPQLDRLKAEGWWARFRRQRAERTIERLNATPRAEGR